MTLSSCRRSSAFEVGVAWAAFGVYELRHPSGVNNFNTFPNVDPSRLEVHLHSVRIANSTRSADELLNRVTKLSVLGGITSRHMGENLGAVIGFDLHGWFPELGQGDFYVKVVALDPTTRFFAVRTLQGHPLAGWRAWEVKEAGNGDLIVRTFSVEHPVTAVDSMKLWLGGMKQMYYTWDVQLDDLVRFSGGRVVAGAAETLKNAGTRHQQFDIDAYYERVR